MEYVIGAAMALIFICGLGAAFFLGYRLGKGRRATPAKPASEEQKRREEQLKRDFEIISGYNLSRALDRKRV